MSITDAELAELYERYGHVVYHRCRSILGNDEDAWDATQETFARVLRSGAGFRGQSSPLTWMYRISTNYCLNQIRNQKGRRQKLEDHKLDIGGDQVGHLDELRLDHATLRTLLADADEQTRACVIHTYFDDCTRQETADLVGISVPTVRKRINTFLRNARRALSATAVWWWIGGMSAHLSTLASWSHT